MTDQTSPLVANPHVSSVRVSSVLGRAAHWRLAFAALVSLLAAACSAREPERPQHVLLIVVDTLRADHLSIFGYPRPTSPNIDRLARNGVLFKRAISQSSFTSPSMVSLMTGQYIAKERQTIPSELPTLAEAFQRAGWKTGGFSANPVVSPQNGFHRGFDVFAAIEEHGPNAAVEAFVEAHRSERTFTYFHINEPHDEYLAPPGKRAWREAASYLPGDRGDYYQQISAKLGLSEAPDDVRRVQEEIGGYDDEVRYADERVAALLAVYERLGLMQDTLVVLTADHGEGLWEQVALMSGQRGSKLRAGEKPTLLNTLMPTHGNQVHQSLVHVPLVISGPGVPRGVPVNTPVENVDLFPTLLELADVSTTGGLQGSSLVPLMEKRANGERYGFSYTRFNVTVVDQDGWALILPTPEGECAEGIVLELHKLDEDPHQRRNLAAERPQIVERLKQVAMERQRAGIREGDPQVTDENLRVLAELGYVEQVERGTAKRDLQKRSTAELLALLAVAPHCTERLLIVEELAGRALDDAALAALRAHREKERALAVQAEIDKLLAK